MAMTKVKALQMWCKKMADGYRDVEVKDMAASWKSGLAFCAIIHRFRPDLIDYDSLSKENVFDNNQLAFEVAEKQLNIPAFLEAADMVAIRVPDKLSVVTYVSQYYNYFHDKPQLGGPGVSKVVSPIKKKDNVAPTENKSLTPAKTNVGNAQFKKERQESMGDRCFMCHEKVYLLERHIENAKLYHRSCFRKSELSPTSKVFKRQPYNAMEEEKNGFSSNKLRKIDTEKKMETSENKDSVPDFWQRRAQEKAKVIQASEGASVVGGKTELKSNSQVSDVPFWKRGKDKTCDTDLNKTGEKKSVLTSDVKGANKSADTPLKSTGLVNKFKELNERNLKSSGGGGEQSNDKVKDSDKNKTGVVASKVIGASKVEETASHAPMPRPRNNIPKTFEKMDTAEKNAPVKPKAAQRLPKYGLPVSPKPSPRNNDIKANSPQLEKKTEFTRPKTPPQSHKSDFSLNLSKQNKTSTEDGSSPSSPPPLPHSSPPKLDAKSHPATFQSRRLNIDSDKSPMSSPRFGDEKSHDSPRNKKCDNQEPKIPLRQPVKPPRAISVNLDRSSSPMEVNEIPAPSKAVIHEPSVEHKAVLTAPKRHNPDGEQKNREVFGGLLKSLAVVRNKHDAETPDRTKGALAEKPLSDMNKKEIGVNKYEEKVKTTVKEKHKEKKDSPRGLPQRPKSSFVSQSSSLFDHTEDKTESQSKCKVISTVKTTTTTTKVVKTNGQAADKTVVKKVDISQSEIDSDIPAWKRQLDARKAEKARPKSADILGEKSNNSDSMPEWQKEAEKRKQARKGGYIDPEKVNRNQNTNSYNTQNITLPLSPPLKKSSDALDKFSTPQITNKQEKAISQERQKIVIPNRNTEIPSQKLEETKKKITIGQKFVFEDIEPKVAPKKPNRPSPPQVPPSPKSPTTAPARPPPPKTGPLHETSPVKHHLTAYQIQQQLHLIDSKLTKLELKGRKLEDSIRNAKDEEEDVLMINWFQLVNEKNELVRKECDYIYISRSQELEIEQQQISEQIREKAEKQEVTKSEEERKEEEFLMEKLMEVVNQRNKIVDTIDEDRLRYLEEDREIEAMLQQKGFSKEGKDHNLLKKDKKKSN